MKHTIRSILSALLSLLILVGLSGCAAEKEDAVAMHIDYGKRADGSSYAVYNGDAQEFFEVAEGKENAVEVTVTKESGTLRITIHKEEDPDAVLYDGHDFPAAQFTVTAREPGRYRILVHAEDFIGSYSFRYDMG